MRGFLRVSTLALALSCTPAVADKAALMCVDLADVVSKADEAGFVLRPLQDRAKAVALMAYLADTNRESHDWTLVVWAEGPAGAMLLYGKRDRLCVATIIPPSELERVRLMIFGPMA
jgi:hypothetical protein